MELKELIGRNITIEDIEIDSYGDLIIIGRGPTEIKTYDSGGSYPIHKKIKITCIAHGTTYTRCGDLKEHSHLETIFDEWDWNEEWNDYA